MQARVQTGLRDSAQGYRIVAVAVADVVAADAVHGASCFARDEQNAAGVQTFAETVAWCGGGGVDKLSKGKERCAKSSRW